MTNIILRFLFIIVIASSSGYLLQADEIGTAFGITIGKPIPENIETVHAVTNKHIVNQSIAFPNTRYISSVWVSSISTKTNRIVFNIQASGRFKYISDLENAYEYFKSIIKEKYGTNIFENQSGNNKKARLHQGNRYVEIIADYQRKEPDDNYTLIINYGDDEVFGSFLKEIKESIENRNLKKSNEYKNL